MDFEYFAQVTFIRVSGKQVPWEICFTSSREPFDSFIVGLSTDELMLSYDDFKYNMENVDHFPRPEEIDKRINYLFTMFDIDGQFEQVYNNEIWTESWIPQVGALDQPTYDYLLSIIRRPEEIKLVKEQRSVGENKTFAVAARKYFEIHKDKLFPENNECAV